MAQRINQPPWRSPPNDEMALDDSRMELWFPEPNVVCTRITGHFHHAFAKRLMVRFDEVMASGQLLVVWHDWGDATGFDNRVKVDFTTWAMKRAEEIERVNVFAKSTFLRLAIKVSNLATGNRMRVHDSREVFRRAAQDALSQTSSPTQRAL